MNLHQANKSESPPLISVVIPTYNRPKQIKACLTSLTNLEYPRNSFEVIVVDDGSPEPLDRVVAPFRSQLNINLVRQTNAGAGAARNTGAQAARGEYIAFTDDDCAPASNWLTVLTEAIEKDPSQGLGGLPINALTDNAYSAASQLLIDFLYDYYFPSDPNRFFASNNVFFASKLFHQIGGFDTRFPRAGAEDRDFCRRWLANGYGLTYVPEAIVYHSHKMTLKGFIRQHFYYGRGAFNFHSFKKAQTNSKRLRVEPIRFYTKLLFKPFTVKTKVNPFFLSWLMFVSQAANVIGFFYELILNRTSKQKPEVRSVRPKREATPVS